ncbi:MAG: GGDEF domain-containing protein [Labilithrix sp.]
MSCASLGELLASLRTHDVLARYGGDEFVALLPDAGVEQLTAAVRRIGAAAHADGISLSIGGATWPGSCAALEALFATADAQLYLAKRDGRGCAYVNGARCDYV